MSSKNFLLNEVREAWNTNLTDYTANFGLYSIQVCKTGGLLGKILDILGWNTRHVTITVDKSLDKRDVAVIGRSTSVKFKCDDFSDFNEKIGKVCEKIRTKNFEKNLQKVERSKNPSVCVGFEKLIMSKCWGAITAKIFKVLVADGKEGKEAKKLDALEVLEEYCKLAKSSPKRRRTEVEDRILQDVKRYLETISEVLKHARDTNSTKCKIYGNAYTSDYVNYANAYLIECNKYVTNFVQIIDNIDDVVEDNSLNEIIKFFENSKIDGWIAFKPDDIDDDTDDTNDDEVAYEQDYDPYSQYEQK